MNLSGWLLALLVVAVLLAWVRLGLWQRRAPAETKSRGWRLAALFLLQPLCAALLYFTLLPPTLPTEAGTLVVATAGATSVGTQASGDRLVALPEAPTLPAAERVPDLATSLRRYPGMQRLRIVGAGLEPRDREAAMHLPLVFDARALPRGVVRLDVPDRVAAGDAFQVGGRVHGVEQGTAELIDPAGRRVDALPLPASGEFVLAGAARGPGLASFTLRVRDAQRRPVEELQVPLWTIADPAPRALLLAGAPSPELKYLRRWATDAGVSLHTQISVGGGMQLGDAPLRMDAPTLQRFDLLLVDERSWAALGAGERAAVTAAVRKGLGLLLRITGPLPDATRRQWQALGFALSPGGDTATVRLPAEAVDEEALRARRGPASADAAVASNGMQDDGPTLARRAIALGGGDTTPLARDGEGNALAVWRAEGLGRIAVWNLSDSFVLALSGQGARHAELWSDAFATLARARTGSAPRIERQPREQQRMALCGLGGKPQVVDPDGRSVALLPDPATGDAACAAYWPLRAGWHALRHTDAEAVEHAWPFFVHAADAAPTLRAAELREATLRLAGNSHDTSQGIPADGPPPRRGPSWPWFLAWLTAFAALAWLERSRRGRTSVEP
ncbi:MAG: carboxypeptidase regulatory-like domain-containing protein [Pseudoxanthomonas sp.]